MNTICAGSYPVMILLRRGSRSFFVSGDVIANGNSIF
jgi:hypothetical protein